MKIGAGGINKQNLISVIVCSLLSVCLTLFLSGIEILAVKKNNDEIPIELWQYVWVKKPEEFNYAESNWKLTTTGKIENASRNRYLHLRTEIESGGTTNILTIRSGNNLLNADVDGKRVYEQLITGELYSGASNVEIVLEPSDKPHKIDIYLYAPSVLRFSASLKNNTAVRLRDTAGLLLGALLFGASVALFFSRKSGAYKNALAAAGVTCLILGFCAIIGQSGLHIRQFSDPIFNKIFILLFMYAAVGIQYMTLRAIEAHQRMNWVLKVSGMFPICFLVSPYNSFTQFILGIYAVWCAVYVFLYLAVLIGGGMPSGTENRAVIIVFITAAILQSLYWLSYYIPFDVTFMLSYLIAAGGSMVTAAVFWSKQTLKTREIENESEVKEDLYKRIQKFLLEKADTNMGHLENVSNYVRVMCRQMKMPESTVEMVSEAALLHDIGKIALPMTILKKEESVDKNEYEQLRSHVLFGYNILIDSNDAFLQTAANIAMYHHERYDGSGYLGRKGKEIDLFSRLTAIADTFDALTSNRSYKKAWSFDEAHDYINLHAGDYFDPELVRVFNACRKEIWEIYQKNRTQPIKEPVKRQRSSSDKEQYISFHF